MGITIRMVCIRSQKFRLMFTYVDVDVHVHIRVCVTGILTTRPRSRPQPDLSNPSLSSFPAPANSTLQFVICAVYHIKRLKDLSSQISPSTKLTDWIAQIWLLCYTSVAGES